MNIATPRWLEDLGWRASLHVFRGGIHVKVRRGDSWRHLCVKVTRGHVFGKPKRRTQLWVGWWQSRKGVRGDLAGFRLVAALDRLPPAPPPSIPIPFYPQQPRTEADAVRSRRGTA